MPSTTPLTADTTHGTASLGSGAGDTARETGSRGRESESRGVEVAEYDVPHPKTVDGVADVGFALSAWFVDPSGNTSGLLQFKDKGLA